MKDQYSIDPACMAALIKNKCERELTEQLADELAECGVDGLAAKDLREYLSGIAQKESPLDEELESILNQKLIESMQVYALMTKRILEYKKLKEEGVANNMDEYLDMLDEQTETGGL